MAKGKAKQTDVMGDEWNESEGSRQGVTSRPSQQGGRTSVARVTEITATSTKSFEDAIRVGIGRANKTLRNVRSAWIKEQQVRVSKGSLSEYQVNMLITFVLDD